MIPTWLTLVAPLLAWGQSTDDTVRSAFPRRATVRLDGCGSCDTGAARVRVPPGLRSVDDPTDGSDLLLLDAGGQPVPFAVARGEASPRRQALRVWRHTAPDTVSVEAPPLPIDGLEITVPGGPVVARVVVRHAETGEVLAGPTLVWTHEVGEHRQVELTPTTAPLTVSFSWLGRAPSRLPGLTGLQRMPPSLAPDRLVAPVVSRRVTEDGVVDYTVQLDDPVPVRAIDLGAAEASVISRMVEVYTPPLVDMSRGDLLGRGPVKRVRVGEATLDAMTVPLEQRQPSDRLVVTVESRGQPILEIDEVGVLLEGEALWFQPTGPGPYTLLGGAPAQTRPPSELQVALAELVRLPAGEGRVSELVDNPDFVPPVLRSGLGLPGRLLPEPDAFAYTAAVSGAVGMVRIPLPAEVQAASASQLRDLRLTDLEGRQVPHLLRRTQVDPVLDVAMADVERTEDGGVSRLVVPVPDPEVAVATLTVHTEATAFRRIVSVLRPAADHLVPLRSVDWSGADRPGEVGIAVDTVVGDTLVVEIDNGDDPPLPVDALRLSRPGWELVAVVPEGGATLHVGDPRRAMADFDLQLYADDLTQRAVAVATVGPLVEQAPAPLAMVDRAALLAGLVVLVGGLAGLTVRLLRSVPDGEDPENDAEEAVSDDEAGEADPGSPAADPPGTASPPASSDGTDAS